MKSVRISIVIPVYNSEEYLDKCLSSIVVQDMNSYDTLAAIALFPMCEWME